MAAGRGVRDMTRGTTLQLPLELGVRTALGREDFLVAPNNEAAVAWIDRWPDWPRSGPTPALVLTGPLGCGKTHLAHAWRSRSDARLLAAADIKGAAPDLLQGAENCIVEDADKAADETALLHLFNHVGEQGGALLLNARTPPARWRIGLADLASRLRAAPVAAIEAPGDGMIEAVLVKLFGDRQIRVGPEVVAYLTPRIERSFAGAQQVVALLDRAAMAAGRGVTIPLAREVLDRIADEADSES